MPRNTPQVGSALAILALSLSVACTKGAPKFVLVFVDGSASIDSMARQRYQIAWRRITDSSVVGAGDRIVLARIDDATYDSFRPVVDVSIPTFNPLTDNSIDAAEKQRIARARLAGALDAALSGPLSKRSRILDAFAAAPKVFGNDTRRRRLIIISDGYEDSDAARFGAAEITENWTRSLINKRRERRELPDLTSDTVLFVGAPSRRDIERFWVSYVSASRGVLPREGYAPILMNYAP